MNYGRIYYADIANGVGCRTSLFLSGCRNHCKECFNPETWDFSYGKPFDADIQETVIDSIRPSYIEGLSILGGEPMEPENQEALLPFLKDVKTACPNKTVWLYSGFTWEELTDDAKGARCRTEWIDEILPLIDILVDGRFELEKKNISLKFRGSENQRIIKVPASLKAGEPVLADEYMN